MRPIGDFAHLSVDTIRRAEMYQALALENIRHQFNAEDDEFSAENMRWDLFVKELESARESGTMQQFNEKVLTIMAPALQQILTPQPEQTDGRPQ